MSLSSKRTLPPTLKKGIRRRCCKRRTLGAETRKSLATSAIVRSANVARESVGIFLSKSSTVSAKGIADGQYYSSLLFCVAKLGF